MNRKEKFKKGAVAANKITNKLVFGGIILVVIHTMTNVSRQDVKTEFTVYESRGVGKRKKTEFMKLRTHKIPKPVMNKNLLSISYDAKGNKNLEYRRHVGKLLFLDTYGGVGVSQMRDGSTNVSAGITVGF